MTDICLIAKNSTLFVGNLATWMLILGFLSYYNVTVYHL